MSDETLTELLGRFGFSDKEIDTYLTLLEHGEAKASEIADDAGVSKRYVYSVSEELEKRGLVEQNSHVVPATIRARPPAAVTEQLKGSLDAMQDGLEERYQEPKPTTAQIDVVKSKPTVIKRIQSFVDDATQEITLSIPSNYFDAITEQLRAAVDRGVVVMLIVTNTEGPGQLSQFASVGRSAEMMLPIVLTVDHERGVFAPPRLLLDADSDLQGIIYVQEQLSPVISAAFFGNYWPVAAQTYVTEPDPLPATFGHFRHAVLQATLHLREETPLRARVIGTATADGATVDLYGKVADIKQSLVEPATSEFPIQQMLLLDTDDGPVSVGGLGAFVEDVEAETVELEPL